MSSADLPWLIEADAVTIVFSRAYQEAYLRGDSKSKKDHKINGCMLSFKHKSIRRETNNSRQATISVGFKNSLHSVLSPAPLSSCLFKGQKFLITLI